MDDMKESETPPPPARRPSPWEGRGGAVWRPGLSLVCNAFLGALSFVLLMLVVFSRAPTPHEERFPPSLRALAPSPHSPPPPAPPEVRLVPSPSPDALPPASPTFL